MMNFFMNVFMYLVPIYLLIIKYAGIDILHSLSSLSTHLSEQNVLVGLPGDVKYKDQHVVNHTYNIVIHVS